MACVGVVMQLWSLDDQSKNVLVRLHQFFDIGWLLMTNGCVIHLHVQKFSLNIMDGLMLDPSTRLTWELMLL